jgi:hypothetical protein
MVLVLHDVAWPTLALRQQGLVLVAVARGTPWHAFLHRPLLPEEAGPDNDFARTTTAVTARPWLRAGVPGAIRGGIWRGLGCARDGGLSRLAGRKFVSDAVGLTHRFIFVWSHPALFPPSFFPSHF